ncbi:Pfdn6, partial [Symbiodinium sp. KB8]
MSAEQGDCFGQLMLPGIAALKKRRLSQGRLHGEPVDNAPRGHGNSHCWPGLFTGSMCSQVTQCRLSAWSNPLKSPSRLACVTVCTSQLHCAWKDNFPCASGLLRMILLVASAAHVIVAALLTVSVPVLPFEVPERVSRLLGLEVTPLMALQQMASFLLLELILWPAFPAHEATKKSLQVPRGVSEELRRME